MNKKFWKAKVVLITGFEGFLGSNLAKELISSGAKVIGLDIRTKRKNTVLTKDDYRKITVIKGNVANYELLKRIILHYRIEVVFHLAAEAIVGECHKNPLKTFSSNICGTWNVLEACRNLKQIKSIVVASSDKAYGSSKMLPYKEDTPLLGKHPYDVSKSCADLIAAAYQHSYGLPVAITRCGNIYGPGDFNFSRIVPEAIRCIILDKTLLIRSDGKFTRDYIYVGDIVAGYILIAEKMQSCKLYGEAFNFSNEKPISVLELVRSIYKICGRDFNYKVLNKAKYEIKNQYLAAGKARKVLRWKSRYNLEAGLKKTIKWYEGYFFNK